MLISANEYSVSIEVRSRFLFGDFTDVKDVLQTPTAFVCRRPSPCKSKNMCVLSCILRWIHYIAVFNVAVLWVYEFAVQVFISWMISFCCMLIVVIAVVAMDYIVFSKLHADIC